MHKPLGMRIAGTGRALASRVLDNTYFEQRLDTTHEWILERTGIRERRAVGPGETTASLACDASRAALEDAGMTVDDIDMVIVATITPEAPLPATACFVQKMMFNRPVPAFDLVAACSGFVYGMLAAAHFLQSGLYRNILVIGAEVMTSITDPEDRATAILFGDGAGAAVLSATPDASGPAILHSSMSAEGSGDSLLFIPAGGTRVPLSQMTLDERLHYVRMNGRDVYKRAVIRNFELVDKTLAESGVRAEDIAIVIPHQSNARIIDSARERMGIPPEKMYMNIDRFGNTSAASIPICLDECRRDGRIKSGDLVLLIAFGAGFTWASALLRM